jgi:hypothetical protein
MLTEIIETVKKLAGNEYLYFDNALEIKRTPHAQSFSAWGVAVSPEGELWVMDNEEDWFKVQERDTLLIPRFINVLKSFPKNTKQHKWKLQ